MHDFLTSPAFWICLVLATSDAMRDKFNSPAYKWPNSGFRIQLGRWRFTVDFWHVTKWVQLYSAGAFVWWHVPTLAGKITTVVLASILWNAIPKPQHWK